jgi:hypothetical protein
MLFVTFGSACWLLEGRNLFLCDWKCRAKFLTQAGWFVTRIARVHRGSTGVRASDFAQLAPCPSVRSPP